MSADTTEQDGGGEDLRARYLPVSRKELRRRREAELAGRRETAGKAEEPSEEDPSEQPENEPDPEVPGEKPVAEDQAEASAPAEEQTAVDLPVVSNDLALEDGAEAVEAGEPEVDETEEAAADDAEEPAEDAVLEQDVILEPLEEDPEEEVLDEVVEEELEDLDEEDPDEVIDQEDPESADDPDLVGDLEPETEDDDAEVAPVPASRRARRLLQETDTFNVLDAEKLRELDEINQQVAEHDDPNRVDPELLKKQQAMAAKAMQANQERLRKEQEEREETERQERRRRRRERPESEVITRKALRAHMESDQEVDEESYATGEIEPVQARGAHGLELDEIVEHSSRQASWQSLLVWLVIILAVLLVVAVGIILYFVL